MTNVGGPSPSFVLRGHTAPVSCIRYLGKGQRLCSGDQQGTVTCWDMITRRPVFQSHLHEKDQGILSLGEFPVPYHSQLFTQGRDGYLKLWEIEADRFQLINSYHVNSFSFCTPTSLSNLNGYETIASATDKGNDIALIDPKCADAFIRISIDERDGKSGMCMALKLYRYESYSYLLSVTEGGFLECRDLRKPSEPLSTLKLQLKAIPMCMTYNDKLSGGIIGTADENHYAFQLNHTQHQLEVKKILTIPSCKGTGAIVNRGDLRMFAATHWNKSTSIYSWKTLRPLAHLEYHTDSVNGVAFAPHTTSRFSQLATCSSDCKIAVYELEF